MLPQRNKCNHCRSYETIAPSIAGSIGTLTTLSIGSAPPASMAMVNLSMAVSIGQIMSNAQAAQHNSQLIQNASTDQCCALIIAVGVASLA